MKLYNTNKRTTLTVNGKKVLAAVRLLNNSTGPQYFEVTYGRKEVIVGVEKLREMRYPAE
jgi:hypothetical protein